jgi:hypothetical protein
VLSTVYYSPLSYALKMASLKAKTRNCYVLVIKYILYNKVVLDYKLYTLLIIEPIQGIPHLAIPLLQYSMYVMHVTGTNNRLLTKMRHSLLKGGNWNSFRSDHSHLHSDLID